MEIYEMKGKFWRSTTACGIHIFHHSSACVQMTERNNRIELTPQGGIRVITARLLRSIFNKSEEMRGFVCLNLSPAIRVLPSQLPLTQQAAGSVDMVKGAAALLFNTLWLHLKKATCSAVLAFPERHNGLSLHM